MATKVIEGAFGDKGERWQAPTDMLEEFEVPSEVLDGCTIIWARYQADSYEGEWACLYLGPDGELYWVEGSHCSCCGLEGQWEPSRVVPQVARHYAGLRYRPAGAHLYPGLSAALDAAGIP